MGMHWIPYAKSHTKTSGRSKVHEFMGLLVTAAPGTTDTDSTTLTLTASTSSGANVRSHSVTVGKGFKSKTANREINPNHLYSKICFEEQVQLEHGMLANVYCTLKTMSTGNHIVHAVAKHGKEFNKDTGHKMIAAWFGKSN